MTLDESLSHLRMCRHYERPVAPYDLNPGLSYAREASWDKTSAGQRRMHESMPPGRAPSANRSLTIRRLNSQGRWNSGRIAVCTAWFNLHRWLFFTVVTRYRSHAQVAARR
jgi:hypothetical protein